MQNETTTYADLPEITSPPFPLVRNGEYKNSSDSFSYLPEQGEKPHLNKSEMFYSDTLLHTKFS